MLFVAATAPVWEASDQWSAAHELEYARFVETLFDGDRDASWPHLHALLRDRERNLLYNDLGQNEDTRLTLRPDCGDLPYVLRAYFAWKRRLPFRYLSCPRASAPVCRLGGDQSMPRDDSAVDDVEAFARFVERHVMTTVHSSSGRTLPDAELSDFYPIGVERGALRAGNVYIDPYGHALVLAGWTPQSETEPGYLRLVDAQPDGTIARRRFWRGSPLVEMDAVYGGPGFKAFRPLDADGRGVSNAALRARDRDVPLSTSQYAMTPDALHARVEALASPEPLDAEQTLLALVDGLEAQVSRRVAAVARGEAFMKTRTRPIEMPASDVFAASGEWEAYATPVRDWRLLIALDVATGFPHVVARNPERFRGATRGAIETRLVDELARRSFRYTDSDGRTITLTLQSLIDRQRALELGYNPNDCVETRWGDLGAASCRSSAPPNQRERMEALRRWFRERKRPPTER